MGILTISMLFFILLRILQNAFPASTLSWEFCYIYFRWRIYSATTTEIYLRFYLYVCAYYNGDCIYMFVHIITVSRLLCLCLLYNLIVGCTSSWAFYHMSPLCKGYYSTVLLLNSHLNYYVCKKPIYFYRAFCLCYILGMLSCIFPVYYLLCHFCHPCWRTCTIVY